METKEIAEGVAIVGNIDKVRVEKVAWGDYCVLFEVEILTKTECEGGKYGYAIFDVFYIEDLVELEKAEEEIGEETGWYKYFVLFGRVPYLLEIKQLPDGCVEEVYYISIFGWIPERHLGKRKFTNWLKHNDLDLRIRRIVANKPYTKKRVLFISIDKEGEYVDGKSNFIFVYNENDKVLLEV